MRALTVQQPWAWAIIHGGKDVENRTQAWSYRGLLAIHAGKRIDRAGVAMVIEHSEPPLVPWPDDVNPTAVFGAIIGVVDLVDVHREPNDPGCEPCCLPWGQRGTVHLELANPRPLDRPIPCRGKLSLWTPPPDTLDELRAVI